ncbi:hypothetical protein CEXT_590661 [Caerostris extrusa]|uniref:Secreted protein n=1 Tax=Caerostris extrusa TaxID=172846 RepID=A0AAV4XGS6_CAEEX|nr:hypothetical protein CEXT_590661 [Caerostris extrusa]
MGYETVGVLLFPFQCSLFSSFAQVSEVVMSGRKFVNHVILICPLTTIPHPSIFQLRKITGSTVIPCSIKSWTQLVWSFMNVLCYIQ